MGGPFIAFYPSDWLAGTRGLSAAETGVYITLVAMMYEREEPLKQDHARLARVCGLPKAGFSRALDTLIDEGKIIEKDGALWNSRVSEELNRRENIRGTRSEAAKARWEKAKQKQEPPDASAEQVRCKTDVNHNQNHKERDTNVSLVVSSEAATDQIAEAVSAYNAAAKASGWPQVQKMNKARKSALASRLRQCGGLAGWQAALARAQASAHCCGQNDRGWVASFDFLTTESSFTKLMEGNYDNRDRNPAGRSAAQSGFSDGFAAVAQRYQNERRADGSGHV